MACCTFPKVGNTRLPGNHSPIFPLSIPRTGHSECRSSVVGGLPCIHRSEKEINVADFTTAQRNVVSSGACAREDQQLPCE